MVVIASGLKTLVEANGAVVLDIPRDSMIVLNPTAAYVWRQLEQRVPLDTIVKNLATLADMDTAIVSADIATFLADLSKRKLITGGDTINS